MVPNGDDGSIAATNQKSLMKKVRESMTPGIHK